MPTALMVLKKGVYIQDVLGPFEEMAAARSAAEEYARLYDDGYHDFEIHRMSEQGIRPDSSVLPKALARYTYEDKTGEWGWV